LRKYVLSYLTLELDPPATITAAAEAGYDYVGVRMLPALAGGRAFPLMSDAAMLRETIDRLRDTDVRILDLEIARIDGQNRIEDWLPMLEVGARLGARTLIAAGDDPDESRMTETFAKLCRAAAGFSLSVNLEFTPWARLNTLGAATRVVETAAEPNGEILVDTIHVARSDSGIEDIAAIDPARMSYFQICDAEPGTHFPIEDLLYTAREERLLPGEGGSDLAAMITALPRDLIVSVEIPSHRRIAETGHLAWARTALDASRRFMEHCDGSLPAAGQ